MARVRHGAKEQFIEEVGLAAEADGLPRIAGRLFGHLLLSSGPCSLDEIAEALNVSKGSVSTDARLLLRHGWLRRSTQAGDRKDYYEMGPDFFAGIVAYRLGRWSALHDLVSTALPEMASESRTVRDRLRYLDEAQSFFVDGLRRLLEEWDARQGAEKSDC
jgi:DNA-binding transcriptional regulator GbsR (MarR family)